MTIGELTEANLGHTVIHERFEGILVDYLLPIHESQWGVVAIINTGEGRMRKHAVRNNEKLRIV